MADDRRKPIDIAQRSITSRPCWDFTLLSNTPVHIPVSVSFSIKEMEIIGLPGSGESLHMVMAWFYCLHNRECKEFSSFIKHDVHPPAGRTCNSSPVFINFPRLLSCPPFLCFLTFSYMGIWIQIYWDLTGSNKTQQTALRTAVRLYIPYQFSQSLRCGLSSGFRILLKNTPISN